ncbi:hypothetical protein [Symbiopectobacterium purcellii]|uniref:hypothetical protein n=1 Tax=Symbiopectobacterium purcellii TaxID=2871826 RepID=UPI003F876A8B
MQVETVKLSLARPCKRAQELRNAVSVVRITVEEQGFIGLGECTPAFEYQESAASVCRQLDAVRGAVTRGASRDEIQTLLPPGAARNALDCALWRLSARLGISNFFGPLISGAGNDENRLFYRECLCVWVIFEHIARFLITSPNSRQSFPALSNVTHSRYLPGVRD